MPGMIENGARGDSVRDLQQALVDLGYEIDVDGVFGDGTEAAVIDFQENNGLDSDGIVGANTWRALGFLSPRSHRVGRIGPESPRAIALRSEGCILRPT